MNRTELQDLARCRLKEARVLLKTGHYDGAYYLAGYAIECALKAVISKRTRRHDFPDRDFVQKCYTHNLIALLALAGLDHALKASSAMDADLEVNWAVVKDWSEGSRYSRHGEKEARDIYKAVSSRQHGIMRWLRQHW